MTPPRENEVHRHPHTGEEVLIDHVTDAEAFLRVTDGRGVLVGAHRMALERWKAVREVHGLQLVNEENDE